jgi:WW domain-containing oxidoreductase
VSSLAHKNAPKGGIVFEKINDPKAYSSWAAYGQSKLANILFARALQKHIDNKGWFH